MSTRSRQESPQPDGHADPVGHQVGVAEDRVDQHAAAPRPANIVIAAGQVLRQTVVLVGGGEIQRDRVLPTADLDGETAPSREGQLEIVEVGRGRDVLILVVAPDARRGGKVGETDRPVEVRPDRPRPQVDLGSQPTGENRVVRLHPDLDLGHRRAEGAPFGIGSIDDEPPSARRPASLFSPRKSTAPKPVPPPRSTWLPKSPTGTARLRYPKASPLRSSNTS